MRIKHSELNRLTFNLYLQLTFQFGHFDIGKITLKLKKKWLFVGKLTQFFLHLTEQRASNQIGFCTVYLFESDELSVYPDKIQIN